MTLGLGLLATESSAPSLLAAAQVERDSPAASFVERVDVTVARVLVRIPNGPVGVRPPVPKDIEVREDGVLRRVLAVEPWLAVAPKAVASRAGGASSVIEQPGAEPPSSSRAGSNETPDIFLYVDRRMAGYSVLRAVARTMAGKLAEMARSAPVSIAVADPEPSVVLASSRDPAAVGRAVEALPKRAPARGAIEAHRSGLLIGGDVLSKNSGLVRALAVEEAAQIASARIRFLKWLASLENAGRPRVLFLVGGSFDPDPTDFYLQLAQRTPQQGVESSLLGDLGELAQGDADQELALLLSDWGWVVYPIAPVDIGFSEFGGASSNGHSRWLAFALGPAAGSGPPPFLFTDPGGGWRPLAAASGGAMIRTTGDLVAVQQRLTETYVVSYERPGIPSGRRFRLDVRRSADQLHLEAPTWRREGTPEVVQALRAQRAEPPSSNRGGLEVEAELLSSTARRRGQRTVRIQVRCRPAIESLPLSSSLGVALALFDRAGNVSIRTANAALGPGGTFVLVLDLQSDADRLGVAVEDPGSGLWGTAETKLELERP